jgi:diguanylate cyclase (GGDEF)-like protein
MQVTATLDGEMKFTAAFAARTQVKIAAEAVSSKGIPGAADAVKVIRQDIKKRFELLNANYSAIFITDASGTIYAEAVEGGEDLKAWEIDKHPCFLEAKATRKVVSGDIVRSKSTQEPTMVLCGPIFSDNGAFLGVVGSLLKASVLTNLVTARKIGETGYCFMINEDGIIIAHPDEKNVLKLDLKPIEGMGKITRAMMDGRSGAESYVFKGIDKVAGFVPVKGKGWSIAATQNAAEFLASVYSLRNSIAIIIVISIVIIFVIIFLAASSITRPLQRVIDGLQDIASGKGQADGAKCIAITSNDEIGILSIKFNSLMESINDLSVFKKVIEEDTTLDEVYQRMGEIFTQKLGISSCFIYQIISAKDEMFLTYPNSFDLEEMLCHHDILDNCNLCKAKRTGHVVHSNIFPNICRQFTAQDGRVHHCFPIVVGGATVAVIQFVFDAPVTESDKIINDAKTFKAEEYINESLAVIETKRLMGSLRDSALIDGLTGLHNRRYLQEYAEKIVAGVLRRGKAIGLIMCDLDYFKQVNDTHGHSAGDIVLKETAKVIRQSVREADLVIRFGGEEFLAVLLDISNGESLRVAEKIRQNIEKLAIKLPDGVIQKTISLGTSEFPADTGTLWSCIKYADVALYRAKNEGRNRCVRFTKDMWTEEQV